MKEVIEQAIGLVRVQDWYGVAVLLLPMLVQLLKSSRALWDKVPSRLQPGVPVLLAAVAGLSDAMVKGLPFSEALWQALSAGLVVGVGAIGIYETAWRLRHGAKAELLALLLVVGAGFATSGCAASLESTRSVRPLLTAGSAPRDTARCRTLDDRRTTWGAVATGAVVLGGGSGLGSIPVHDNDTELALAAGAAGMAVVAGVAHFVEQKATESWTRECSQ